MKKNKRYTKKSHKYMKKNKRYTKKSHKYMKIKIGGGLSKYLILYDKYIKLYETQRPLLNKEYTKKICSIDLRELIFISSEIIEKIIKSSTYSLLPYYFLDDLVTLEQQDLIVSKQNSGNCVSFAYMVIKNLKTDYNINEAIIIPATLPIRLVQDGYPEYGHVAVVLETESNFIIFEPAYFILSPIVIKKSGESTSIDVVVFNTKWKFVYDETRQRINVTTNEEPLYFYEICIIENPSLAVSYPINVMNKRIPIVNFNYDMNEKIAHLSIRIDTQKLEGYNINYDSSSDHWYEKFDWKTCLDNELSSEKQIDILSQWDGFSEEQCINLNVKKIELVEKVYSIIKTEWDKIQKSKLLGGGVKNDENYWW